MIFMKPLLYHNACCFCTAAALALATECSIAQASAGQTEHEPATPVAAASAAPGKKMCSEHGLPEEECGICHPELAAKLKPGEGTKVRLPAADSAQLVGVEMAQPTVGNISDGIECYAELAFNQNRLAQITAPVGG